MSESEERFGSIACNSFCFDLFFLSFDWLVLLVLLFRIVSFAFFAFPRACIGVVVVSGHFYVWEFGFSQKNSLCFNLFVGMCTVYRRVFMLFDENHLGIHSHTQANSHIFLSSVQPKKYPKKMEGNYNKLKKSWKLFPHIPHCIHVLMFPLLRIVAAVVAVGVWANETMRMCVSVCVSVLCTIPFHFQTEGIFSLCLYFDCKHFYYSYWTAYVQKLESYRAYKIRHKRKMPTKKQLK